MPRTFMISSIFLNGPFFVAVLHDEIGRLRADAGQRRNLRRGGAVQVDGLGGDDASAALVALLARLRTAAMRRRRERRRARALSDSCLSSLINVSWGPTPTTCASRV